MSVKEKKIEERKKRKFRPIYILFILCGLYLGVIFLTDFLTFKRLPQETILLGKDLNYNLLANIIEINPNKETALIEFSLRENLENNSKDFENIEYFDLFISEGNISKYEDKMYFETQSRRHTDFIRLQYVYPTIIRQRQYSAVPVEVKISSKPKGYLFPFDEYLIRLNFVLICSKEEQKFPTIEVISEEQRLFASSAINNFFSNREGGSYPNSFLCIFYRPKYVLVNFILALLLSICIILWSYYRILFKSDVTGFEIIGLNVSLLISFPTLRETLVPSNLEYAPLYDLSMSFLWILSLLSILTYFTHDLKQKNKLS